jgi:hypothetical protein
MADKTSLDAGRLRANRVWRTETPSGPVIQKYYLERAGPIRAVLRDLLIRAIGVKTVACPSARRATERRLLARWRAAGFDVPEDLTERHAWIAGPRVGVYEFVEGTPLYDLLRRPDLGADERRDVLRRFAADWSRRHAEALRSGDPELLQEHGTIRHVLVAGPRLVTIDFEQAFLPRPDLRPLVAKEIASYLRSLWKRVGPEQFQADLAAILEGYADRKILRAAADEYLVPRTFARRLLWAGDRRMRAVRGGRDRAKYGPLEALRAALDAAPST